MLRFLAFAQANSLHRRWGTPTVLLDRNMFRPSRPIIKESVNVSFLHLSVLDSDPDLRSVLRGQNGWGIPAAVYADGLV